MNSRKVSKEDELRQQTVSYESANMDGTYRPYAFIADTISNINRETFLLLNYYLRRRMIARMGGISNSMMGAGIFRSTYGPMKYYCMSCGTQHKQIACPKCVSKMKRIG
jgi:hypothetical protein